MVGTSYIGYEAFSRLTTVYKLTIGITENGISVNLTNPNNKTQTYHPAVHLTILPGIALRAARRI